MKNKKMIIAAIAFVAVLALVAGVYFANRPETSAGSKIVTVTVVHSDSTSKVFTYQTDKEFLGELLVAEGLIEGENGMYTVVDGETASWEKDQAYWSFLIGEEYASAGMDTTPIADGDTFKLVYTIG